MNKVTNEAFEAALAVDDNQRIIKHVCRKYRGLLPNEELKFRGYMALFNCLQEHVVSKGGKFTTSLYRHTIWQCQKAVREEERHPSLPSIQFEYDLVTTISPEISYVRDCLEVLPNKYSKILKNYYLQGMTLQEIGDENGYTAPAAFQKLRQAESAFRRLYGDD